MPTLQVEDFRLGLDRRKSIVTAPAGSLYRLENAHITAGGEIEQRKAFVEDKVLPAGTLGLAVAAGVIYVFGQGPAPGGLPAGVSYQQLVHPSAQALSTILDWDVFGGKLYVAAQFADGSIHHYYNGSRVTDWADGRARASFTVTGGTASAGVNKLSSIKVNGIEVLGTAVDWTTSNSATATTIAAQITSHTSSPEYTGFADGETVYVIASAAGTAANGLTVQLTLGGNLTTNVSSTTMSGGTSGTLTPGSFVLTFRNKEYSVSGQLLHFSASGDATKWTAGTPGAGFVDVTAQDGDAEDLRALAAYFQQLAVFSRHSVQIWSVDADPAKNTHAQTLKNSGALAPGTVLQYGNNDVFFLSDNGLRSLRARDSSNAAAVSDVGSPVDPLLTAAIQSLGAAADDAFAVIEPETGRYWLILGTDIYVFSFFPAAKVSAWSIYRPGLTFTAAAVHNSQIILRAGDKIYRYGGTGGTTYGGDYAVDVILPMLDAGRPATEKTLLSMDLACEGTWAVDLGMRPDAPDVRERVCTVTGPTYGFQRIPATGYGTHFGVRLQHTGATVGRLGSMMLHYQAGEDE